MEEKQQCFQPSTTIYHHNDEKQGTCSLKKQVVDK